ncbi:carboxymuconolactone decarboxylase family protein [Polymorphobacter arshaanensis]|nr:carboxymuconolactone decarboxylase family protein [Polymorphobacter arshaanensis]
MARIELLTKPYPPEFAAVAEKITAPGAEPLALFTLLGKSMRALEKFMGGSMAGRGPLGMRDKEIVIDRTVAKCGNSYEWGLHIKHFAAKAELTDAQVKSLALGHGDDGSWNTAEATLIATVDALLANKKLSDAEYARLSASFDESQRFEIVQLVGFYHSVSLLCGAFALPNEAGTATIPTA